MHNLSDEELDRLSREAAGQHLTPAGDAAWDKIKTRLDAEMPSGSGFSFHIIPDLALLLILLIGLPLLLSYPSKPTAININKSGSAIITDTKKEVTGAENKLSAKTASQTQPSTTNTRIAENKEADEKAEPTEHPEHHPASAVPVVTNTDNAVTVTKDRKQNPSYFSGSKRKSGEILPEAGNKNLRVDSDRSANSGAGKNSVLPAGIIAATAPPDAEMISKLAVLEDPVALHDKYSIDNKEKIPSSVMKSLQAAGLNDAVAADAGKDGTETAKQSRKLKLKDADSKTSRMLEIGAVWSPDVSKVGSASPKNLGNIFGMTVGYNFNKRWSVQTGVLYSNKYYTALDDEYKKIPGYNPYDPWVKITKVQAECFMWDIPVNVRYNWYWRPKQRAFVSMGMSSYFMKKEDLHYWYKYYNNPRYKNWVNNESSSYWFSVVNLSAGFEQQIIDGLTVQAEPFVKLSVRQLGYGYVNLKSYGIFLGLKWVPPLHRSKK